MDYSKFRRSEHVEASPEITPEDMQRMATYRALLAGRNYSPDQQDAHLLAQMAGEQSYVPGQMEAAGSQMANPMSQSMGIMDINQLVAALRGEPQVYDPFQPNDQQMVVNAPLPRPRPK